MFDAKQEKSGVKVPPLPEPPVRAATEWDQPAPPLVTTPSSPSTVAEPGSEFSGQGRDRVLELEAELERARAEISALQADRSAYDAALDASNGECERLRGSVTDGEHALAALVTQAHDLEKRVDDLVEELAARDVMIAELTNDNEEMRTEYDRRGQQLTENQGLLQDSQERVEVLESRLRQQLERTSHGVSDDVTALQEQLAGLIEQHADMTERNRQLEAQLAEARSVQEELLVRQARRTTQHTAAHEDERAHFEREVAVARALIGNLESEVESKEGRIAGLFAEISALRNILKNVDARSIEAAKRRMGGR